MRGVSEHLIERMTWPEVQERIDAGVDAANKGLTAGKVSQNINLGATGAPVAATPLNIVDSIVDMGNVLQGSVMINTTATYFFALTAVDTNNLESGFSSEVSLAVNVDLPPGAGMGAFEGIGSLAAF